MFLVSLSLSSRPTIMTLLYQSNLNHYMDTHLLPIGLNRVLLMDSFTFFLKNKSRLNKTGVTDRFILTNDADRPIKRHTNFHMDRIRPQKMRTDTSLVLGGSAGRWQKTFTKK